ncbi:MAG: ABC transporter permease [Melioribacteraceae bacterium]|nr:ABC transporter permease [Melioribacteraceae bacterium]MCF8264319.1 ABC transporter permease [Melioribacteraceae bacterium]MCF8412022.1 ABC transporter permease [Melioribacteraceae bacterium]MCF8431661.1 ABC transporter permease [Melioribacteraceae bacterium]
MDNILVLAKYTFKEALSRKIFLTFFAVSSLVLFVFLYMAVTIENSAIFEFFRANDNATGISERIAEAVQGGITFYLFAGGLFLSIFSVSSFIPNMLEKGMIDVLLSKPVSRAQIIIGKFLGGTVIVYANIIYVVVGFWLIVGLKLDTWNFYFLLTSFAITFTFMVLYAMIILTGILTKSSILAMIISYLIFFILSPLLAAKDNIIGLFESSTLEVILNFFYYIVPQTAELAQITNYISTGTFEFDTLPIFVSFLFMILNLAAAIFIFNKKDY